MTISRFETKSVIVEATLLYIDAPHFYCGVVLENGVVKETAPIVSYMGGWGLDRVKDYCLKKGWKCGTLKNIQ